MTAGKRPLSPHLQVYRPQITSVLSITHRITGLALAAAALLFTYWLTAAAYGPAAFARAQALMGSAVGLLILFGFTFSLFFHLLNGIRHLVWDAGRGFEMPQVRASGWAVVVLTLLLTAAAWIAGFAFKGGM